MKHFGLLIFLFPLFINAQSKRVLFLGNSYTNNNNLPQLTATLAASADDTLIFDSNTPGGYTFQAHTTNSTSLSKIAQGDWDFVVLQEQSQRPSFPQGQVENEVFPYARQLDSLIHAANPCTETVFYMTWGRKNGDASNCAVWPPVCTYEGMDNLLNLRYRMMADSNDAIVSPVGETWKHIRANYPGIELYRPDESHPSMAGSYAAACCFYTVMFRKNPNLITTNSGLDSTTAARIRMTVEQVVYDSLSKWHVGEYDLMADFETTPGSVLNFFLQNKSLNADSIFWTINDSIYTGDSLIVHFPGNGLFPIELTAFNNCDTAIKGDTVSIFLGIGETDQISPVQLSPNPTQDFVQIHFESHHVLNFKIIELSGRVIKQGVIKSGDSIDLQGLSAGNYLLEVRGEEISQSTILQKH